MKTPAIAETLRQPRLILVAKYALSGLSCFIFLNFFLCYDPVLNGIKLFFILKPSLRSLDPPSLWEQRIIKEVALSKATGGHSEHDLQRSLVRGLRLQDAWVPGRVGSPDHSLQLLQRCPLETA